MCTVNFHAETVHDECQDMKEVQLPESGGRDLHTAHEEKRKTKDAAAVKSRKNTGGWEGCAQQQEPTGHVTPDKALLIPSEDSADVVKHVVVDKHADRNKQVSKDPLVHRGEPCVVLLFTLPKGVRLCRVVCAYV